MNPDFEKKVIEDLELSGFSSELRSIRTFISKDWKCSGFANFYDLDQKTITGVDLRAWLHQEIRYNSTTTYGIDFHIEAEVKKSEKPWVLFKEYQDTVYDDNTNNLVYFSEIAPYKLKNSISHNSIFSKAKWRAYGLHESFKKPTEHSRSYSALIKACKAAESALNSKSAYYKELKELDKESGGQEFKDYAVIFVKPVIILDGKLLAANLSDKSEISIEEIKFATVEFYYNSEHCKKGRYLIDIVTLENLPEYIDLSESRQEKMFDDIENHVMKIKGKIS